MPDLRHSLSRMDYNHHKIVAEKWRLPFSASDSREGINLLVEAFTETDLLGDLLEALTHEELGGLRWLENRGGKGLWSQFVRQFGEVREMGAGRLDRERPDKDPVSPAEGLWYRALIGRGFFETESGSMEFAYIPDDLRSLIMSDVMEQTEDIYQGDFQCRLATPQEREFPVLAAPEKLDHICTLLAALRTKLDPKIHLHDLPEKEIEFFQTLFLILGLIEADDTPIPENIRDFFDLSPGDAMVKLWQTWSTSETHLDLALVGDLILEGSPEISPRRVRGFVIGLVEDLDPKTWWSLPSFISQVKEKCPDFLRSGGDYDAWFIKEGLSGEYLRGFEHWEDVEGALLRYLISGPLHWLGVLDVAKSPGEGPITAFRHSSFAAELFSNQAPGIAPRKPEKVQIRAKGEIRMTPNVPHKTRYQIARFCDWGPIKADSYLYSISPASLQRAEEQGLRVAHLLALLRSHTDSIPPNIQSALERWEKQGVQASIEKKTILRLGSPAVLRSLKKSKAERFIIEQLGPTTVVISEGSESKIKEVLVELGFFIDIKD